MAVASPVSDTDDSGPNFAVRVHVMILANSIAEFVGVFFCKIGQRPRLAADDRGKVIEDFVGFHRSAISQLGVTVENILHIGRLRSSRQHVMIKLFRGTGLVAEGLADDFRKDRRDIVVRRGLVSESIGLAVMSFRVC